MIQERVKSLVLDVWQQVKRFGLWCKKHPFKVLSLVAAIYGGSDIFLTLPGCYEQKIVNSLGAANIQVNGNNNSISFTAPTNAVDPKQIANEVVNRLKEKELLGQQSLELPDVWGLPEISQKAMQALSEERFDRAVEFAVLGYGMATNALQPFIGKIFKVKASFAEQFCNLGFVISQEALRTGNYDLLQNVCNEVFLLLQSREVPYFAAMYSIAETRIRGGRFVLFAKDDLMSLKNFDKRFLDEYLGYLNHWGYLSFLQIDGKTGRLVPFACYEYFGLQFPSDPAKQGFVTFRTRSVSRTGKTLVSNEASVQWIGFNSFVGVDLTEWKWDVERIPLAKREIPPLKLTLTDFTINRNSKDSRFRFGMAVNTKMNPDYKGPEQLGDYSVQIGAIPAGACAEDLTLTDNEVERNRVPEPTMGMLLLIGCAALALKRKRNHISSGKDPSA